MLRKGDVKMNSNGADFDYLSPEDLLKQIEVMVNENPDLFVKMWDPVAGDYVYGLKEWYFK